MNGKISVVSAKAGIHKPLARANSLWIPAFAGTTEVKFAPNFESHPLLVAMPNQNCT